MKSVLFTFLCIAVTMFCQATNYVIHEIPELSHADKSKPITINNRGEILGSFEEGDQTGHFFWSPQSGLTIIGGFPSNVHNVRVENMNNKGQAVGTCVFRSGWFFKTDVKHGFRWSLETGFEDLGAIDDKDTYAVSGNDSGKVVLVSGENCYIWENGYVTKIESIKGLRYPTSYYPEVVINNKDQIAFYQDLPNGTVVTHDAKIYNMNTYESRSLMDGHKGVPFVGAINDFGTVAGSVYHFNREDGFLAWPTGAFQIIENFKPYGINNDAVAVGSSFNEDSVKRATLFKDGVISDLTELSLPLDKSIEMTEYLMSALDINDKGAIVATMTDGHKIRTVLLEPFEGAAAN